MPGTTSFDIIPDNSNSMKYTSSQATREAVCKIFRISDCALKVNKITNARNNGIRIEAISLDLEKVRAHSELARAGLKIVENIKMNPRLIVHGVPSHMSTEEIKSELIAQNVDGDRGDELKVMYLEARLTGDLRVV